MRLFIIHCPERIDRYNLLLKELEEQEITDYEIIPAEVSYKNTQMAISKSHKKCIQLAKERGLPECLIAEDDLWFMGKGAYKRFLDVYRTEVPEEVDMLYSGLYDGIFTSITLRVASVSGKISGLHLYIVRSKFYDAILGADENYNIDFLISSPDHLSAKGYCCYPFLCLQHDTFSDNVKTITTYNEQIGKRFPLWNGTD